MEISDIRLKLVNDPNDRLRAVCSITFDGEFVVRDLKVVQGSNGLFVAMPSRKLSAHCPKCGHKNHIRAGFCNDCGSKLPVANRTGNEGANRTRLHSDVAHPISATFREKIQQQIIEKFQQEKELARDPNYEPADIDAEFEDQEVTETAVPETKKPALVTPPVAPRRDPNFDFTDYDSLIAGLRSGTRAESEKQTTSFAGPKKHLQSAATAEDGSAAHKPKDNAVRSTRGPARNQLPRKTNFVPKAQSSAKNSVKCEQELEETENVREAVSQSLLPSAAPERKKVIPPTQALPHPIKPPIQPASPAPSPNDGELPFGAGIL
ncbi:MAG: septation protein SpoVG family protein [Planctomycetes bacterium]|nr:septation protein SpoVG family protein [Planctomycetota bacterium]